MSEILNINWSLVGTIAVGYLLGSAIKWVAKLARKMWMSD